jgi:dTDP-4-dehydrorhamnose reductase
VTLLVTGADGQLGRAVRRLAPGSRFTTRGELDLASADSVAGFDWSGVSGILNAAAYTAVDAAEDDPGTAWATNAVGVLRLADPAQQLDVPLLQVSTDYVFGDGFSEPIPVDAEIAPRSVYGASKAAGELAARRAGRSYVVRTGWVFGDGHNFVRTMLRLGRERSEVQVVDDQFGRPTHAADLAAACLHLLDACPPGVYHATGVGDVASWAEVASAVLAGGECAVKPISTDQYPTRAPRPRFSALEVSPAVSGLMRDWRVAVAGYVEGSVS